jgi:hypothetical protein
MKNDENKPQRMLNKRKQLFFLQQTSTHLHGGAAPETTKPRPRRVVGAVGSEA